MRDRHQELALPRFGLTERLGERGDRVGDLGDLGRPLRVDLDVATPGRERMRGGRGASQWPREPTP